MLNLHNVARAARKNSLGTYLALMMRGVAVATIGTGLGAAAAYAAVNTDTVSLTAEQITAIQNQLTNAIAAVNAQGLTGDALDAALAAAIAQVEQSAINTYGVGAVGEITSTIIAAATGAGVSPEIIGTGLGDAATAIAATDLDTATAIAQTVANEGTEGMGTSFASAVNAAGGPASLASAATGSPLVTGSIKNLTETKQNGGGAPHGPPPPPCANPSCT